MSENRDTGYDYSDKRVAVIGNGSSAIQIVPKLQKITSHITNFMRSPTWISAGFSEELTPEGKNFKCNTHLFFRNRRGGVLLLLTSWFRHRGTEGGVQKQPGGTDKVSQGH